ncbi:FtsX-like permease family protein [Nonomuraea phyllanthi]|uniref:FtsX-like permease family protein n=1 Tax=Nonomuraea phyllanthi TaxID=2219224 RepID=A0A5C4WI85_9ACTN|nr:ABC transporter permease [Nonomuraea phyllanthi]KAB8193981.1 FtsX-like permease family protein [Nonomuraea phyllanthi]QFY07582.1 FtsX-like permease family protein [Nonomuraea phyllanthi]
MSTALRPARLRPTDLARIGTSGLRARPARAILAALGIAIGIATMVTVVGISASSQERLLRQLDELGTNLLRVSPGDSLFGDQVKLPENAAAMVKRIDGVTSSSQTAETGTTVRRNDLIPEGISLGITVQATSLDLLSTLDGRVRQGTWLNAATERQPVVVLGAVAAERLGMTGADAQVYIGDRWFTVIGVLDRMPLAEEIERSALVGFPAAKEYLDHDGHPTTVYERSADEAVESVRTMLARTVSPESPNEAKVSRPSDALKAKAAAAGAFTGLMLGLGAVALFVGGVGVANTMVVAVLERRREIGLRRSFGATRAQVRNQFLVEALLLSAFGGGAGVLLGALATFVYAQLNALPAVVPLWAVGGGLGATIVIGALAGIYPALRAARVPPTVALTQ